MLIASKHPTDYIPIKFTAEQRVIIDHYRRVLDAAILSKDDTQMGLALRQLQKFVDRPKESKHKPTTRTIPYERVLLLRKLVKDGVNLARAAERCRITYSTAYGIIQGKIYRDVV